MRFTQSTLTNNKFFVTNKELVLFIAVCLSLQNYTNAQTVKTQRKVVSVISPQRFYLNGGFKASFGGISRQVINLTLPKNTVEWCYAITASPNNNQNINLNGQIAGLIDPSGLTSALVGQLMIPAGAGMCNTYLLDQENSVAFLQKVDNNGGNFRCWPQATRQNFTDGVVVIKSPSLQRGSFYLGVKNPSTSTGMYISLEVSAIVEEEILVDTWSKEQKETLFSTYLGAINSVDSYTGQSDSLKKSMAACIVNELIKIPPSEYFALTKFEQQELSEKAIEKCLK